MPPVGCESSMKLRTKFNLAITIVFSLLAAVIAVATIGYVETNRIREAENRVRTCTRAAWEIHNSKVLGIQSASEILTHMQTTVRDLLKDPGNERLSTAARTELEAIRQGHDRDILIWKALDTLSPLCMRAGAGMTG